MLFLRVRLSHVSFLAFSVLSAACGKSSGDDEAPGPLTHLRFDTYFADSYYIEDEACQTGAGIAKLGQYEIHRWQGGQQLGGPRGQTGFVPFAFEQDTTGEALRGGPILGTHYGLHQKQECKSENDCDSGEVIAAASALNICRPSGRYARASIEGVALASLSNLAEAQRFLSQIPGRPGELGKFRLLVLPVVEKAITVVNERGERSLKRQIMTDNLAYAPSFMREPTFIVFPKGRSIAERGLWQGLNLWELPWGMAHEFGHHVFRTYAGLGAASTADASRTGATDEGLMSDLLHFDDISPIINVEPTEASSSPGLGLMQASSSSKQHIGAVNEGYADLFSHYSFGGTSAQLQGVDCFDKNRDLAHPAFASGEPKELSSAVLLEFELQMSSRKTDGCTTPSFTDMHTIGAIIAHGADRILSAEVGTAADANLQKAQLLIQWAVRIKSAQATSIKTMLQELLATVAGEERALNAAQCTAVREVFSSYARSWLDGTGLYRCEG